MKTILAACAALSVVAFGTSTAFAANPSYCHNQAIAYANQYANPAAGAVGGGVIGAIGGGILGEVLGQGKRAVGAGALVGGGVGAAVGHSRQKKKHDQIYREAYYACMNQPAPRPIQYRQAPPAGSPDWNYYCSMKYKSFRAADGTFQPLRPYQGAPLPPRRICVLP